MKRKKFVAAAVDTCIYTDGDERAVRSGRGDGASSRTVSIAGAFFDNFNRLRVDLSVVTVHLHRSLPCLDGRAALITT